MNHSHSCVRCDISKELIDGQDPGFYCEKGRSFLSKKAYQFFTDPEFKKNVRKIESLKILRRKEPREFQKFYFS